MTLAFSPKKSPLRHADVHAVLIRELAAGRFPVGSRFPGEDELQKRFGVGRHTVREALTALADEGYIARRPKSGTIVLSIEPAVRYVQSLGTIENLFDFGINTELQVRAFGFVRLRNPSLCELLKLRPQERWLQITGLRTQRETSAPLCWTQLYIPPAYAIERSDLDGLSGPVYALLLKHHGLRLDHVEQEIGATALTAGTSSLLHVPSGSPALTVVRRYFGSEGSLIQSAINLYPAGRYFVRSRIERQT